MGALGLALFSALSWGTADFFGGLTTRRFGILLVGVVSQTAGLVLTGSFIVIGGVPGAPAHGPGVGGAGGGGAGEGPWPALSRAPGGAPDGGAPVPGAPGGLA